MRVMHLVTRSHRRGAEVVAVELAAALDALGHRNEVLALALATNGQSQADLPALVPTTQLTAGTLLLGAWRLRRRLRAHPADIVLAHGATAAIVVALTPRSSGGARVWQRILGLDIDAWSPFRRAMFGAMARRYSAVVALTAELESEVRRLGYEGPVWVIPNARDPERFASVDRTAAGAALRAQLEIEPDVGLLGFVGHLYDQKQPELAVDVLAKVLHSGHPAHLVVAGDGPRRANVEERVRELGVGSSVTLLGHRDDPEAVFGGVDVVLLTSLAEGIPGVAIEAQMTGCPVVSFPVGGIADVVADGLTGVILPRPDPDLMASCIAELLSDPARLDAMGVAGARRAGAFSMAAVAAQYEACLHETRARTVDRRARH